MKIFGAPRKNFLLAALMGLASNDSEPLPAPTRVMADGLRSMHPRKSGPGRRGRPRAGKHAPKGIARPDETILAYGARYSNVLTAWNTDRNLAKMAKRHKARSDCVLAVLDEIYPEPDLRKAA